MVGIHTMEHSSRENDTLHCGESDKGTIIYYYYMAIVDESLLGFFLCLSLANATVYRDVFVPMFVTFKHP